MKIEQISVTTDGVNWKSGPGEVRVLVDIDGEEDNIELLFTFTNEGLVIDCSLEGIDDFTTQSEMYSDIVERLA